MATGWTMKKTGQYIFFTAAVTCFFLLWFFFFTDDLYNAWLSAVGTAMFGLITTMFNE